MPKLCGRRPSQRGLSTIRSAGAIIGAIMALLLALSGCGSTQGQASVPAATATPPSPPDVTPGTLKSGGLVGYLLTCDTFPAEPQVSCFLRPLNGDGSPRWTLHIHQSFGAIIADSQTIYIALTNRDTGTSVLAAYNTSDGAQRWQTSEEVAIGPNAVTANAVYGGRLSGGQAVVAALSAANGTQLWATPVGQYTLRQVIVSGGTVYCRLGMAGSDGPPDDHVVALDAASGKILWKVAIMGRAGPIAVANGAVFVRADPATSQQVAAVPPGSSTVTAYRDTDGVVLWRRIVTLQSPYNVLLATDNAVYAAGTAGTRGGIVALRASTGAPLWSRSVGAGSQFFAGLVALNGTIYSAAQPVDIQPTTVGHLYAFAAGDGSQLADHALADGAILQLSAAGNMLYVWTNPSTQPPIGNLEALRPTDFSLLWKSPIDNRNAAWFQPSQ